MRIGILGPATVEAFRGWLDVAPDASLPDGHGGPITTMVAQELLRGGHELVVCTLGRGVPATVTFRGPQLTLHVCPLRTSGRTRDAERAERRALAAAIAPETLDVAHAWWTYEYAFAALAAATAPLLVTAQDWGPVILRYARHPYWAMRMVQQLVVLRRAPHVTAPSPYLARLLERVHRSPVEVIPNMVADAAFGPAPTAERPLRGRLLCIADGFAGRKNTATLLEAFALLRAGDPELWLTLVGEGHGPGGAAEAWARARGLAPGVEFLGRVPHGEIVDLMHSADVLVHPSKEESFGMTLIEAAAQGTPVVAGATAGAVPWVLDDGRAGRLVDVADPAALAAAVAAVRADPAEALRLARAAHARAAAHFRLSVVTASYVEAYERVRRDVAVWGPG